MGSRVTVSQGDRNPAKGLEWQAHALKTTLLSLKRRHGGRRAGRAPQAWGADQTVCGDEAVASDGGAEKVVFHTERSCRPLTCER